MTKAQLAELETLSDHTDDRFMQPQHLTLLVRVLSGANRKDGPISGDDIAEWTAERRWDARPAGMLVGMATLVQHRALVSGS